MARDKQRTASHARGTTAATGREQGTVPPNAALHDGSETPDAMPAERVACGMRATATHTRTSVTFC